MIEAPELQCRLTRYLLCHLREEVSMNPSRLFVPIVALSLSCGAAAAQTPALDGAVAPRVALSAAQKQTIYQSISRTQKNNAAPTGFRAAIGAPMPEAVMLAPVPATIANLMPQTKGLEATMVEGQVMLVDPASKQVLAVIVKEP
jgi:hypothetical protein